MFTVSLELTGFDQAVALVIERAGRQALEAEATKLREAVRWQFLTEGEAYGTPWPARKRPAPGPLLRRTGRLFDSLTLSDHPEHVETIQSRPGGGAELLFGTRVQYAGFHQTGTRFLARRPLLTAAMLAGSEISWPL